MKGVQNLSVTGCQFLFPFLTCSTFFRRFSSHWLAAPASLILFFADGADPAVDFATWLNLQANCVDVSPYVPACLYDGFLGDDGSGEQAGDANLRRNHVADQRRAGGDPYRLVDVDVAHLVAAHLQPHLFTSKCAEEETAVSFFAFNGAHQSIPGNLKEPEYSFMPSIIAIEWPGV